MNDLPQAIFAVWGHSFEEDHGNILSYRPADYAFPRARGRASIEFRPDGTFIDWVVGPADANRPVIGHWHIVGPGRMQISFEGDVQASRILEILECDAETLKIRQIPLSPGHPASRI
jgi:hypothetical protein